MVDYNLRARQLLRYAAAKPAQPHADTITSEHLSRARFLQPQYDPAAEKEEEKDQEQWPAQWAESANSLRGFVTCKPWKDATKGYLVAQASKEDDVAQAGKEDDVAQAGKKDDVAQAGMKDVAAEDQGQEHPSAAEPAPGRGPRQPNNETTQAAAAAAAGADLPSLTGMGMGMGMGVGMGVGTVTPPQTQTPALALGGGGSRIPVPVSSAGARPLAAGGAARPLTGGGGDTGCDFVLFPPLRETGRNTATTGLYYPPPLPLGGEKAGRVTTATVSGAVPPLREAGRSTATSGLYYPLLGEDTGRGLSSFHHRPGQMVKEDTVAVGGPFPRIGESRGDTATSPSPAAAGGGGGRYTAPDSNPNSIPLPFPPPLGQTAPATDTVPGAYPPAFGETEDTPAPLFSSLTLNNLFGPGPGGREPACNRANGRSRNLSRSVSPKDTTSSNPVTGGGSFTEEEMDRFRAWVAREERKKAREAGRKYY